MAGYRLVTEWRAGFPGTSVAFEQFCPEVLGRLQSYEAFPPVAEWNLFKPSRQPAPWFRFVVQDEKQLKSAGGYDYFIRDTRGVPSREESWHDLFNALVWQHFPKLKTRVHQLQLQDFARRPAPGKRTALGDVATLLDECGAVVLSSEPSLLEDIRELRWRQLFFERRAELAEKAQFLIVGHALLHALLEPYIGLMGRALLLPAPSVALESMEASRAFLDDWADEQLKAQLTHTSVLFPLPLLGIPGYSENNSAEFYDGLPDYFRTRRRASV